MNNNFKYVIVSISTVLVALLLVGAVLGQSTTPAGDEPYRHLNVFTEVFSKIKSDYVEDPDMKNVTLGAINGLLVSVDPFASYLNADQYKQYLKAREKQTGDVGLVLSRKFGAELSIVDAIEGSPADKAGLSTGDIIEAINGVSTRDMPLAYAEVMLHGEPGSTVELTALRLRKPEPTKITLTRVVLAPPPIIARIIDGTTGYIAVQDLTKGKTANVAAKIKELEKQGATKLVLDLRHTAETDPAEGAALANLFLDKGTITSLSGQKVPKKVFEADSASTIWHGPLVVLTNRGTTGAAEVAAAALQENNRAKVVGERTYGDAALRRPVATEDGGAVLLAVAKYYTPGGKAIQDTSVTPSVQVSDNEPDLISDEEPSPEQPSVRVTPAPPGKPAEDLILKKALDVLSGKAEQASSKGQAEAVPGTPKVLGPLNVPVKQ